MAFQLDDDGHQHAQGPLQRSKWTFAAFGAVALGVILYYQVFASRERPKPVPVTNQALFNGSYKPVTAPMPPPDPTPMPPPRPQAPSPQPQREARPVRERPAEKREWQKMIEKKRLEAAWAGPLVSGGTRQANGNGNGHSNGNGNGHSQPNGTSPQVLEIPSAQQASNGHGMATSGTNGRASNVWNSRFDERGNGQPGVLQRSPQYVIQRGWEIPARLITPINTDTPGQFKAMVTQNVMDSTTGRYCLIPYGSQLVGGYDTRTVSGQKRVNLALDQINFPNGTWMELPAMPGADRTGLAGIPGDVNTHFWARAGNAALLTITGAGAMLAQDQAYNGDDMSPNEALAAEGGRELRTTGRQAFGRGAWRKPTITVPAGEVILVQVTRQLTFPGPYQDFTEEMDFAEVD